MPPIGAGLLALGLVFVGDDESEPCERLATPERAAVLRADVAWIEEYAETIAQRASASAVGAALQDQRDPRLAALREQLRADESAFDFVRYGQALGPAARLPAVELAAAQAPLVVWLLDDALEAQACWGPVADIVTRDGLELVRATDSVTFTDPAVRAIATVGWMPLAAHREGAFHEWLAGLRDGSTLEPRPDTATGGFGVLDPGAWRHGPGKVQALLALGRPQAALAFTSSVWHASRDQAIFVGVRHTVGLSMWDALIEAGVEGAASELEGCLDALLERAGELRMFPLSSEATELLELLERFDRLDDLGRVVREQRLTGGLALHAGRVFDLLADSGQAEEAALVATGFGGGLRGHADKRLRECLAELTQASRAGERGRIGYAAATTNQALRELPLIAERHVRVAHGTFGMEGALVLARHVGRRHWACGQAAARVLAELEPESGTQARAFARNVLARFESELPAEAAAELEALADPQG